MSIGERIKNLRKENNLTQVELAKKSNISRSYLADIEKDRYNASLDTLKSIASSLNVSLGTIVDEPNNNSNELTSKDQNSIQRDLKILMDEFKDGTDGAAYYNGQELTGDDLELIETAMKIALEQIKVKNKDKYTPKKYKK